MSQDKKGLDITSHLNFYRIHILVFTFTPLFFSGILYASNGRNHLSYIDCLFNCVSAVAVCGLASVDLSSMTAWQQTIIFIQMCLGSPIVVSWVMVYIRRYHFNKHLGHIIEAAAVLRRAQKSMSMGGLSDVPVDKTWRQRIADCFVRKSRASTIGDSSDDSAHDQSPNGKGGTTQKLRIDMIRRMEEFAPQLVNPSGWISEGHEPSPKGSLLRINSVIVESPEQEQEPFSYGAPRSLETMRAETLQPESPESTRTRRISDPGTPQLKPISAPESIQEPIEKLGGSKTQGTGAMPRSLTVEFAPNTIHRQRAGSQARGRTELPPMSEYEDYERPDRAASDDRRSRRGSFATHTTAQTHGSTTGRPSRRARDTGFGGFPMPHEIVQAGINHFFPEFQRKLTRTMTVPRTTTIASQRDGLGANVKPVPYISFDAVIGRNSSFHMLSNEQLEELGGVEYRAINALLWIVPCYHFAIQIVGYIVIAPYMARGEWKENFVPPMQKRPVASPWFSLFQVVSSYTNTGMSLVDHSMVPFQKAYPMIFFMIFLILAGNTAFPIFLRFTIWILSKLVPNQSRANETLHFLLDHPRRCFIYLFPSHQTWFLLTIVVTLTLFDWFFFMVLDINNPTIEAIPLGTRFVAGFLQAIAVRAAGFGIVSLAALAPAVKVLYVVMMYISVYPIALSVRSTNVYEEKSLGVFSDGDDDEEGGTTEETFQPDGGRVAVWSRYLAMHARQQLAFDMWWMAMALFLVCIIERPHINDAEKHGWFDIFNIIFELVSAYGTVGLSLGMPTENYSFSGSFRPLSKLIVCLVMIRGRHRGLPVAIDRAIMIPSEYEKTAALSSGFKESNTRTQISVNPAGYTMDGNPIQEKVQRNDTDDLRKRNRMDSNRSGNVDEMRRRAIVEDDA